MLSDVPGGAVACLCGEEKGGALVIANQALPLYLWRMTSAEVRQSFLDFFREKQHAIVPSSSLLPSSPNLLFTNAGMNQFVPYFLGAEKAPYQPPRAADTQKCIRAGGKHNDLDDVGLDTYHQTFFEMLGNWSFGDYFKTEAIHWAWELLVDRWKFPAERLYATVYRPGPEDPGDFDQEAYDLWAGHFIAVGLDPKIHVVDGSKKDNFWMMGETGPCGPCSEVHVDLTPKGDTRGALVNRGDARCIEIWNLVFIQFNAEPDGTFKPLPARHVDTGMGFERVVSIMQGSENFTNFSRTVSNYDTDVFRPIFDHLEALSGLKYESTMPSPGTTGGTEQQRTDIAFRVIADHLRTLSFAIADGIQPGNNERAYVLRRILRRAVRYGRTLGFKKPFFYQLVGVLADHLGAVFPELKSSQERIVQVIRAEEESFNRTLDKGIALFEAEAGKLAPGGEISGAVAFRLYDEQGFPVDLTEVMAREADLTVDRAGFEVLMDEQRNRARAAQNVTVISAATAESSVADVKTDFVGFELDHCKAWLVAVQPQGDDVFAVVDRSPLYAAMGGQVGDTGTLLLKEEKIPVLDTIKRGDTFFLKLAHAPAEEAHAVPPPGGKQVPHPAILQVDEPRRRAIEAHHTATHLLHWALHRVVGQDVAQKGSYVGPDRLRFDFNSAPLAPAQIAMVERLVNEHALANEPVTWLEIPYAEASERQDIMQLFGEKYMDQVRVVQIGGTPGALNGYSMELCGGTHVRSTGQLGLFKIVSEGAIAAGTRRIEAVAGIAAYHHFNERAGEQNRHALELEAKVAELSKALDKERLAGLRREADTMVNRMLSQVAQTGSCPHIIEKLSLGEAGPELLPTVLAALKGRHFRGVVVLAGMLPDAVHLAASVSPEYVDRFNAGKLLQQLVPIVGGKGGGKPDLARGAGREPGKVDVALKKASDLLA